MQQPSFIFGTQYFRPPFPERRFWEDDIKAMRDAGLNALQLWVVWGWCEPEPGRFDFDDYDRIADLADRHGVGVVLSTLPEINPFWLPRVVPDGLMIDIEGRPVASCNRNECISGLVPGLCSDHPEVRRRMTAFLETCGSHFGKRPNLLAWDCWNENRWRNHAPDIVCFCPSSTASFQGFLRDRYGSLDKLGHAWGRRYCDWRDVRVGRLFGNSYPEMHDFTGWLCRRCADMARWRVDAIKRADPDHVVGSHTGNPSIYGGVSLNENIFSRGIDWDVAAGDCYGFSSFLKTYSGNASPVEVCVRMSSVATVAGERPLWMSEMQGGQMTLSGLFSEAVGGEEQQAWVWAGIARGAKACIFWCWRDEVFGSETNGCGVMSTDGFAADRVAAMRRSSVVLAQHGEVVAGYRPDRPEVAVLFQRDTYFYDWMGSKGIFRSNYDAPRRLAAWPQALERLHVPYAIHDDHYLPPPHDLKLVIVPDAEGLNDAAVQWLLAFARAGGTVLIEGVANIHRPDTFMRYPHERPLDQALGLRLEMHRKLTTDTRIIPAGAIGNQRRALTLRMEGFEAAWGGPGVIKLAPDDLPMIANVVVGAGRCIVIGSLVGRATAADLPADLDALVSAIVTVAGATPPVKVSGDGVGDAFCSARIGTSGNRRLLVVVNMGGAQRVSVSVTPSMGVTDATPTAWFGHSIKSEQSKGSTVFALEMNEFDHEVIDWPAH